MRKLFIEVITNDHVLVSGYENIISTKPSDFIGALVTLCDRLDIDIPVWTSVEDNLLMKNNLVTFYSDDENKKLVRVSTIEE